MKHVHFIFLVAVILMIGGLIHAQNAGDSATTLTLSDAIERSLANDYLPRIQRSQIERARGQRKSAGLIPNPVLSYYREDWTLNGAEAGEWIISGQLPLNFMWERWPAVSAASARVDAEEARLSDVQRLLTHKTKKAFVEYDHTRNMYDAWREGVVILEKISRASAARLDEGDVSGYEHRRIALELERFEKQAADAAVDRSDRLGNLAFLINQLHDFDIVSPRTISLPVVSRDDILAAALQNRPDLQAELALVQGNEALLSAEKWRGLPDASLLLGYKEQRDEFGGTVMQLNLGIPLFDRNQGRIQETKALIKGQTLRSESLKKQVLLEVNNAFERYQIYRQQYLKVEQDTIDPVKLLQIARNAYQEGETSLIQLIDAVRAFVETQQSRQELRLQVFLSLFELEKVAAISLAEYE